MPVHRVRRAARSAAIAASFILLFAVVAFAQQTDPRQNAPGKFDFYVLALSWSPSYCVAARQRAPARKPGLQCGGRPFAFVVHGLWPQYRHGFPSYCQVPAPRLTHSIVAGMLALMPSPQLIFHEWQRHGTCSGLTPHAYFETVRKARAVVKIPAAYLDSAAPLTVSPAAVAYAFVKANAGLTRAAMAVACNRKRLTEVRLCLSKDFGFHACPDVASHGCKRDKILMPAVRGSASGKVASLIPQSH
ncbi:MAG: ribonuclease T2 [Pseudolabrys sp.]